MEKLQKIGENGCNIQYFVLHSLQSPGSQKVYFLRILFYAQARTEEYAAGAACGLRGE